MAGVLSMVVSPDEMLTAHVPPLPDLAALQRSLDEFAKGTVGVLAVLDDPQYPWAGSSGTAGLDSQARPDPHGYFRIGSITKTFIATLVLEQVAAGRLSPDDTVEQHLPGLVGDHGNDGRRITVRMLLNHTSGLHDYVEQAGEDDPANRYRTWRPGQLVALAVRHRPEFEPGTDWGYSNTNYVLAGMLLAEVTGQPYARVLRDQLLVPLGLDQTSDPGTQSFLPGAHSAGYIGDAAEPVDITAWNPSVAGASGAMVSTGRDLNRFFSALFGGRVLSRRMLAAMLTCVRPKDPGENPYGLGIERFRLGCGTTVYGHVGSVPGFRALALSNTDGSRTFTMSFTEHPGRDSGDVAAQLAVAENAFCGHPF